MSIKTPELLSGKGKIVMGFWHNWSPEPGQGYKQGRFTEIRLSEIPVNYNVIVVAFMKVLDNDDHIPDFKPYKDTESEFRRQVDLVHLQGRKVLISLGGADAHIELHNGDEVALANRIIALTKQYDFDGLDIDLEQAAITAANNQTVIPSALKIVKDHFRPLNKNFIISMAPEFPYLTKGREYNTYIESLEGYYDYIAPQFYNQGGDGVYVEGIGWIAQNNEVLKEDFLYYLTESLVTGTRGFIKIPHDKFIIGLPSNNDAAATGYVIDPQNVYNALARLKAAGQDILGLMTWSINWDAGFNNSGEAYAWEFINRYGYLAGDGIEPGPGPGPGPGPEYPQWTIGKRYDDDDMVHWDSSVWRCLMVHDSNSYWAPNLATSLWRSSVIDNNRKGKITVEKCSSDKISTRKSGPQPRHGHVFSPASRAYIAWQEGKIDTGMLNQRECGKFFPAQDSGLTDIVAPSDVTNFLPPPDGKIASANQGNGNFLDDAGTHWSKHNVMSAEMLKISWYYSAPHSTRRWNYFITRKDWNPNLPLSRAQFEDKPFYKVELTEQPYWSHGAALTPPQPTEHNVMLPQRSGYHVLLAVWEVANTGNAFYHVIDLDFSDNNNDSDVDPVAPDGLRANSVTASSITLKWNASVTPAFAYRLYRDGNPVGQVTELTFIDSGLSQNTAYSYAVSTLNEEGTESALSQAIIVRTSDVIIPGTPPTQPSHLHSMGVTVDTVKLMWGGATSNGTLAGYIIYRDGNEIARTSVAQLTYDDSALKAGTIYRYFVVAFDTQAQLSVPSNVLSVKTSSNEDNGSSQYPEWKLGTYYPTGKKVSYQGKKWICLQAHTAYVPEWAPSVAESLWRETA